MGGSGSGRWRWHEKKTTAEECLILSVGKLVREGIIAESPGSGWLCWTSAATGERRASLGYNCEIDNERVVLRLRYTVTRRDGEAVNVDESIWIQTTPSAIGGRRWWFNCPLILNDRPCGRRVGKLYLPPGARYLGCRLCYDLTYTSCQESHRYDRLFSRLAADTGVEERLVKAMFAER